MRPGILWEPRPRGDKAFTIAPIAARRRSYKSDASLNHNNRPDIR